MESLDKSQYMDFRTADRIREIFSMQVVVSGFAGLIHMDVEIECFGAQERRTWGRPIHRGTELYQVEPLNPLAQMALCPPSISIHCTRWLSIWESWSNILQLWKVDYI